jgi:hypothetical protein
MDSKLEGDPLLTVTFLASIPPPEMNQPSLGFYLPVTQ